MENSTYEISENVIIADKLYKMILFGHGHERMLPGQFIDIALPRLLPAPPDIGLRLATGRA